MRTFHWARPLKGAAVTALAVLACHTLLATGFAAARAEEHADPDYAWAGTELWLATFAVGLVLAMPLLLWAGMRLLREKDNHLLVVGGSLAWFFAAGRYVDTLEYGAGRHVPWPLVAGVIAVGGLLSWGRLADRLVSEDAASGDAASGDPASADADAVRARGAGR
ncbi:MULTISPECIES: hypothetical protein [Streptomyces]|uniref:hypothetical protein n=1 Tax=Streptomyces TaxID=1883 RepID=UPI00163CAB10|nr:MULTISPECIES: hypothetical protein [Streptomyces]MBC2874212.1 hypothetical protein [Streptomyces sp. TYQ1024]UBI40254.1 hypothetical protein K7I03_29910 [Streptomyces mobaraensis]UKW32832.1 hypothetical protein MCU78_29835 [Streptomyces sp. TYQ1024]